MAENGKEVADNLQSLSINHVVAAPATATTSTRMTLEERFALIRSIGEECIQEEELIQLLKTKPEPIAYDGFEPSGRMHIAQGAMKILNVNKLISAGCRVKIWIADVFAEMNDKMGGDRKKIEDVGKYFIEVLQAGGMNVSSGKVEFLWAENTIKENFVRYDALKKDIGKKFKLARIEKCCQIMGRKNPKDLNVNQIMYPVMQCADVFLLEVDICQLGMDQRKVNMLAREYCDLVEGKKKPVILSHHMLPGLLKGQEKMSKSDPSSSIYMNDTVEDVKSKINKAYCPPKTVEGNPCMEYVKYIALPWFNEFKVERKAEFGGPKTYKVFEDIASDFEAGALHPSDLKSGLVTALNEILQPIRNHFNNGSAKELLQKVQSYMDTK